jgi:hypothetical protein
MKKLFLFLFFFIFLLTPLVSSAGTYQVTVGGGPTYTATYEGLVPCGKCVTVPAGYPDSTVSANAADCAANGYYWRGGQCHTCPSGKGFVPCTFCHIFVMIDGIVDFILLRLVPPVATIVLIAGGVSFYFASGSPERANKAKAILTSAIIGLVIIYTSWIIINEVFNMAGLASWVGFGSGWFQINCKIIVTPI